VYARWRLVHCFPQEEQENLALSEILAVGITTDVVVSVAIEVIVAVPDRVSDPLGSVDGL
jgi:hypothetical protein